MYICNGREARLLLTDIQLDTYYEYIRKYNGNVLVDYDLGSHILTFTPLEVVNTCNEVVNNG